MAAVAAALLAATALVHGFWAFGGVWPARDGRTLAKTVVGPKQQAMPGAAACLAIAALLAAAVVIVLARSDVIELPGPSWIVNLGTWVIVAVLALRGIGGLVTSLLAGRSETYHRLDVAIYSPLCLLIAALCLPAATA